MCFSAPWTGKMIGSVPHSLGTQDIEASWSASTSISGSFVPSCSFPLMTSTVLVLSGSWMVSC